MKRQNVFEVYEEISTNICLLHLVAKGEFDTQADLRDAVQWFYDCGEDCVNCEYNKNCLCTTFVARLNA